MIIKIPSYKNAFEDGLIDVTNDFSPERILAYYYNGIFCWFEDYGAIFWFSPPERLVIYPEQVVVSKSMKQLMRKESYTITINKKFEEVVDYCGKMRSDTWLNQNFKDRYMLFYENGICLSVEIWNEKNELVGGLFGTKIGNVFSGESMFSLEPNTSKLALIYLCKNLGFDLIDCQAYSSHLASMGGVLISRKKYLSILVAQDQKVIKDWGIEIQHSDFIQLSRRNG